MKSSTGDHYLGLDHIRALAAFMVIAWHFMHGPNGYPLPFNDVPVVFPLVLFDEGHVGVALFMTLSGYLFAKLLDGKAIVFSAFIWNRGLRLLPLLVLVIVIVGARHYMSGADWKPYLWDVVRGVIYPTLPNGGWSITVEFHFYLILPLLLWLGRRWVEAPLLLVAAALMFRVWLYWNAFEVQPLSYWTIIGRIDQFILGILAFQVNQHMRGRHTFIACVILAFCLFYTAFDIAGGFWRPSYPSKSELWIFMPTVEGLVMSVCIAWYDTSFRWAKSSVAVLIAKIGDYSYSIYLLHFFIVFKAAKFVHERVMNLDNFYVALAWSAVFFLMMVPIGYLSYRFIESPFLRHRRRYTSTLPATDSRAVTGPSPHGVVRPGESMARRDGDDSVSLRKPHTRN